MRFTLAPAAFSASVCEWADKGEMSLAARRLNVGCCRCGPHVVGREADGKGIRVVEGGGWGIQIVGGRDG